MANVDHAARDASKGVERQHGGIAQEEAGHSKLLKDQLCQPFPLPLETSGIIDCIDRNFRLGTPT